MRGFRALLAFLFMALTLTAARAAEGQELEFQGERFHPRPVQQEGRLYWSLADPEVARLLSRTTARLNWSSDGATLAVTGTVRESLWKPGRETVRVDGVEGPAPGLLLGQGPSALMEPQALLFALSLKGTGKEGRLVSLPLVGEPRLGGSEGGRFLRIPVACAVRCETSRVGEGTLRLRFPGCAWDGPERQFRLDDVDVFVSDRDGVVLDLHFPDNWEGTILPGLGLTEVLVGWRSNYGFPAQKIGLSQVEGQPGGSLLFHAEAPLQYYWHFERSSRRLTLDLPGLEPGPRLPEPASPGPGLESGSFRRVGSSEQPVLRFEGILAEGQAFEFTEVEGVPGTLVLRLGPAGQVTAAPYAGSATTSGFVGSRGVLVLDPGHGGGDPGCVNRSLGVLEKDITLDVAFRLRDLLEAQGWTVLMTREDDRDVSWLGSPDRVELQARCDVANAAGADLFLSLHCNASVSSGSAGTSVHWFKQADRDLASSLEFALGQSLGLEQDGLSRDGFYVLRHTDMPAVLVEMAFLSNPREGALLADGQFRQRIAEGLAGALVAHMSGRYARATNQPLLKSAP